MAEKNNIKKFLFPFLRLTVIVIFVLIVVFSFFYVYSILDNLFFEKSILPSGGGFDIEKFKKFAPRFGITLE